MEIAQEPTQSLAALNRLRLAADICVTGEQQDVTLALVIPLGMIMFNVFVQRPAQGALTKETTWDKHSSFTERTQRSA
jgi:hypothetical protein